MIEVFWKRGVSIRHNCINAASIVNLFLSSTLHIYSLWFLLSVTLANMIQHRDSWGLHFVCSVMMSAAFFRKPIYYWLLARLLRKRNISYVSMLSSPDKLLDLLIRRSSSPNRGRWERTPCSPFNTDMSHSLTIHLPPTSSSQSFSHFYHHTAAIPPASGPMSSHVMPHYQQRITLL